MKDKSKMNNLKYIILSVVLCVFIMVFFLFHALQWAFAETVNFGDTPGYVVCTSEAYANANGDVAKYCCSHGVTCLYKNSRDELVLVDETTNQFIGIWWNDTSFSTSAAGSFTSGSSVYNDAYYYFNIGYIGNATFLSTYPMFDNEEYALRYADGDLSLLQFATNYDDLVSVDSLLDDAVKNYYFSDIGNNYATFILETNSISSESYRIFARVTYVSCSIFSSNVFNDGVRSSGLNEDGWNLITNNGSVLSDSNIILPAPSLTSGAGWHGLAGTSHDGTLYISESDLNNNTAYPAYYYKTGLHPGSWPLCGALCQYYCTDFLEVGTISPGATFSKSFNMHPFVSPTLTGLPSGFSFNSNMPLCYQVEFYIVTNDNRKSDTHVLLSSIDGSLTNSSGKGVTSNQGQTIIGGNGPGSTSFVDTNGNNVGQYGDLSLDNSNIIEYIQNGMGLSGNNGIIAIFQNTLGFIPSEIWAMIAFALALSIVLMVIKILRGM